MYCNQSDLVTDAETITTMLSLMQEGARKKKKIDQETIGERALKETPRHKKKASSYQKNKYTPTRHHTTAVSLT